MTYNIQRAMVIGSGVMGGGIAAHLANAGLLVHMVDVVPSELTPLEKGKGLRLESPQVRNRIVHQGLDHIKKLRPPGLFSAGTIKSIIPGNLEDHLNLAGEADWIIEAVIDNLDVKRRIMTRIEAVRKKGAIVSTNTSGIPIHRISEGRSPEFKAHFMGTHFFNPARYLKLLELIPTENTDADLTDFMKSFVERRLGKSVVICKDSPNFIANRVGVVTGRANLNYVLEHGLTIEEVDAVNGPLIGRPKTATFRLLDLVGTDVNKLVTANLYEAIPHDPYRKTLGGPASVLIEKMMKAGLLGNKNGQGFYKKVKGAGLKKTYQVLNLKTLEYRDQEKPNIPIVKEAMKIKSLGDRLKFLSKQDDPVSELIWHNMAFSLSYCSQLVPEITEHYYDIDNAVRAGFSHEMGPFEIWDALGVPDTMRRMEADGFKVAPWVKEMVDSGTDRFYKRENTHQKVWEIAHRSYSEIPSDPFILILSDRKSALGVVERNPSASLLDIGDDVLCLEFHSKANALNDDIQTLCDHALDLLEKTHVGLVIGNQGKNFSGGTDMSRIIEAIESKQWSFIDKTIKDMQNRSLRLRYSPKPVVAATLGMTLGGGAEIVMAADGICSAAETYMGLPEIGIGLIPATGGCMEMARRIVSPPMRMAESDALPFLRKAFENIAMGKISGSALEAKEMGFLTDCDRIIMNTNHVIAEAKRMVLEMVAAGYYPPTPARSVYALGHQGLAFLAQTAQFMVWSGFISEYDRHIATRLAHVLSGGPLSAPQWVDEQYFLDLEREVCLSLCGEEKTVQRIKHILATGKPLKN